MASDNALTGSALQQVAVEERLTEAQWRERQAARSTVAGPGSDAYAPSDFSKMALYFTKHFATGNDPKALAQQARNFTAAPVGGINGYDLESLMQLIGTTIIFSTAKIVQDNTSLLRAYLRFPNERKNIVNAVAAYGQDIGVDALANVSSLLSNVPQSAQAAEAFNPTQLMVQNFMRAGAFGAVARSGV